MAKFLSLFAKPFPIIGMIHVRALPGTPLHKDSMESIISSVRAEANIYRDCGVDGVLVENMHDIPYIRPNDGVGPEITAAMTRVALAVRETVPDVPCGVQILAGCNREALAVAKICQLQFIRAEGFVFSHMADEGFTDACAGSLLRYRKQIDADDVLVITDIKKKHSSHAITADVSIAETAHAAEFFLSDGLIVTGSSTGCSAERGDLQALHGKTNLPLIIGSGLTLDNLQNYWTLAHAAIVGSHFKINGNWNADVCRKRVQAFMNGVETLRRQLPC